MNKVLFFHLLLAFSAFASVSYTIDLDRVGDASITVSLADDFQTNVLLPDDATNFVIIGGSYQISNNTAFIETGASGFASFSFSSSMMSEKKGQQWTLTAYPPADSSITIFMPPYSVIGQVEPGIIKVSSEDSRTEVEAQYADRILIEYSLDDVPIAPVGIKVEYIVLAISIILSALIIIWAFRKKEPALPEKKIEASLELTDEKKLMMETFNENDLVIVNFLLENKGKAKRNELERKSRISKSSLAVALNRLEKRKIIEIDRGATTHFIKLTDYFLKL